MMVVCLHLVHHVLLLVELSLVLGSGILVLLVLGNKIVHVGLSLSELHLIHALTGVPVKEGLATEHTGELLGDTLPELLDSGGVTDEDGCHLQALRWDVTDGRLDMLGIHSTKYEEFLFWTLSICSSTSLVDIRPRKR